MATASGDIYGEYSKQSRLRLHWEYTQEPDNNRDYFVLTLYAQKPANTGTHHYAYHDSVYAITGKDGNQLINGTGDWNWGNVTEYYVGESSFYNYHNDDGTSGDVAISAAWYTGMTSSSAVGTRMEVYGTITGIPTIPRYTNLYISEGTKGSGYFYVNWSASHSIDALEYNKGDGWIAADRSTHYFYVGASPNTTYNVQCRAKRSGTSVWSYSGSISITTYKTTVASIWQDYKSINSIAVGSSCNVSVSSTRYRIRPSGGSYGDWTTSYEFYNLNYNTTYIIQVEKVAKDSGEVGYAEVRITTHDIARITRCDNFNSNANPYMEYNNSGNTAILVKLEFNGKAIRKYDMPLSGNYTFNLTDAERTMLYEACPESRTLTVRYVVATLVNGAETYWDFYDKTMTVVNANPIFYDFEYLDAGSGSTALTGDPSIVIQNYNYIDVIISAANKAQPATGTRIVRYEAVCGNISDEEPYKDGEVTLKLGYINNRTITVHAWDARGLQTSVSKVIPADKWKDYSPINIKSAEAFRTQGVGPEVRLNFNGYFWNKNFGDKDNEIIKCTYRYRKTNSYDWYEGTTKLIPSIPEIGAGNYYSVSAIIEGDLTGEGFNVTNSYYVEASVSDKTGNTAVYTATLGAGKPGMAIHRNGVSFGGPYDETLAGLIQLLGGQYLQDGVAGINLRNSDIIGVNGIFLDDEADAESEGINFLKQGGDKTNPSDYETLKGYRGRLYYNNQIVHKGINSQTIQYLSLGAGTEYQLSLPENTLFIEPLLDCDGSDYSGGQFVVPGEHFCYITSTDINNDVFHGVYVACDSSGLITISSFHHCGATVNGFRIWYLN